MEEDYLFWSSLTRLFVTLYRWECDGNLCYTQQWTIITIAHGDYMETQLHKYFMSWATLFWDWKARERRAIVFHDMTSADIPLTVSATAFQNQDGGSFTKLWTDFLIKIFRVGKIYANQDTPGNIIIYIKFSWNRPKFPFKATKGLEGIIRDDDVICPKLH